MAPASHREGWRLPLTGRDGAQLVNVDTYCIAGSLFELTAHSRDVWSFSELKSVRRFFVDIDHARSRHHRVFGRLFQKIDLCICTIRVGVKRATDTLCGDATQGLALTCGRGCVVCSRYGLVVRVRGHLLCLC